MQVKPGYKRSDLGPIPEDWDAIPLGHISDCLIGLTYSPLDVRDFGTLVLRSSNIQGGRLAFDDCVYVEMEVPPRAITRKNDILICVRNGSRQLIGKCALIDESTAGSAFGAFMSVLRSESAKFLFFQFQSDILKRQINEVMGATINQITNRDMASFKVIWPPTIAEQEAIAEALSDADALIESLDQLIAKKRQIKQGAMQELLTGKRRLPGFSGEWEVKRLGSVLKFQVGFPFSSIYFNETGQGIRLVKNRDLKSDDQIIYYSGGYGDNFLVKNGDVLIGMDGDFLPCLWSKGVSLLNQRVGRILPLNGLSNLYAFYFLIQPLKDIENVTSSTTVKHLSHGDIEGIEKPLPTLDEQIAIATFLSDMDAELAALESRLAKARQIKQGMMQELLTGRIRLL